MNRKFSIAVGQMFLCALLKAMVDLVTDVKVASLSRPIPPRKMSQRKFAYYTTRSLITRESWHAINVHEREKMSKAYEKARKFAQKKNNKSIFFPTERIIHLMAKNGYHLIRFIANPKRVQARMEENKTFVMTFRKKNELIVFYDDYIWKPKANRKAMQIFRVQFTDEKLENAKKYLDFLDILPQKRDPQDGLALQDACRVYEEKLLRIEHRHEYLSARSPLYFTKQIAKALRKPLAEAQE